MSRKNRFLIGSGTAALVLGAVLAGADGERRLTPAQAQLVFGGDGTTPNGRCCVVQMKCMPNQITCAELGQEECEESEEKNSLPGNTKACDTGYPGRFCEGSQSSHVCSQKFACVWQNGACVKGNNPIDIDSVPQACMDDC